VSVFFLNNKQKRKKQMPEENSALHWADVIAQRIIRDKGDRDQYTLASGITPSGTIHIGKFREIITTELV
jgi:lysyl-tRNA synthetase class 1